MLKLWNVIINDIFNQFKINLHIINIINNIFSDLDLSGTGTLRQTITPVETPVAEVIGVRQAECPRCRER